MPPECGRPLHGDVVGVADQTHLEAGGLLRVEDVGQGGDRGRGVRLDLGRSKVEGEISGEAEDTLVGVKREEVAVGRGQVVERNLQLEGQGTELEPAHAPEDLVVLPGLGVHRPVELADPGLERRVLRLGQSELVAHRLQVGIGDVSLLLSGDQLLLERPSAHHAAVIPVLLDASPDADESGNGSDRSSTSHRELLSCVGVYP